MSGSKMNARFALAAYIFSTLLILNAKAKTLDPYKVLGVERNASQREIQRAFHKLSLQYHPDKNKSKSAQEKFAEINNAYDILSDEEKRKNYDLYGDEKGSSGFDTGDHGGNTYFTSGGPGQSWFTFRPGGGEGQNMGGMGSSRSFSFSFGESGDSNSFGFGLDNIFSDFLGGNFKGGNQFGGFSRSTDSQSQSKSSTGNIKAINSETFKKVIAGRGMTWLLLFYSPSLKKDRFYESIIEEVANTLEGALKAGSINCETETSLCKELGMHHLRSPRVFVYSYKEGDKGSLVEYNEHLVAKNLKSFCQDHLPRFSKRINLNRFEFPSDTGERFSRVLLLSTKKETPVIWRVLSGLYHEQLIFYDTEVHDVSDPAVKKLGVIALPAIVGWLSNGEKHILKTGISVKDLKSTVHDVSILLDDFAKKNKKTASTRDSKRQSHSVEEKQIPLLTGSNFDAICGEATPVCIVGAFRSSKAREKLQSIILDISQKSLSRQQCSVSGSRNSISYALLDATKQSSFFSAFDKSGFKSLDKFLVAYKPKKGKFAAFVGEMTTEEVERFIVAVLNGDIKFSQTRQKPVIK